MIEKEPYYYKIGEPVLINWEGEWREGKIANGYRTRDGLVHVELPDGQKIGFGEARHEEYIKPVVSEIPTVNNLSDLNAEQLQELDDYIEQLVTLQAYVNGFIARHNLNESEVYEKIEIDYEEAMSRHVVN